MILDKHTSNSTSPVNNLPLPDPILLNIEHELPERCIFQQNYRTNYNI